MRSLCLGPLLTLLLLGPTAGAWVAPPPAAVAAEPDWAALIGPWPAAGTRKADEDLAILFWLQRVRTPADLARAAVEVDLQPVIFQDLLGQGFTPEAKPRTFALLAEVRSGLRKVSGALKQQYARKRPYDAVSGLTPGVRLEHSLSYPSGHSSTGTLYGLVLAELIPARRAELTKRGDLIGDDRAMAGVHWPSDVEAGHKLGAAYVAWWLAQPGHADKVAAVRKAEWGS